MKRTYPRRLPLLFVLLISMLLPACGQLNLFIPSGFGVTPSQLPTNENLTTPSPVLITGQPTESGEVNYTNVRYGFSFRYPPTWKLQEGPYILKLTQGTLEFVIGFKAAYESASIASMSPGAGQLTKGEPIIFLGQDLGRMLMVYQDKVKAVFYKGHDVEIPADPARAKSGLVFTFSLYDLNSNYQEVDIRPATLAEIDHIVTSFEYDPTKAQSSAGLGVHSEAHDTFIYFTTCFDLDEGRRMDGNSPGCDFSIYSGGDSSQVEFTPIFPAAFAINNMLPSQPDVEKCMSIQGMESNPLTIAPQDKFICYKTKNGRFGYLNIKQIDPSDGITYDWRTYEAEKLNTEPLDRKDTAAFMEDITIPDGTEIKGGEKFIKTWRLRNNGEATWTTGYALVFDRGDPMGDTFAVPLPHNVLPGETIDVSIELTAPHHRGDYTGWWMLRNENGIRFGSGQSSDRSFYVMIKVTRSVIHTPTPTLTVTTPSPTPTLSKPG